MSARCIICDHVVPSEELDGLTACPKCGSESTPVNPAKDVTVRINTHELRILTMWATFHASSREFLAEPTATRSLKVLSAILQRLRAQLPGLNLTLADDARALQQAGHDVELVTERGDVIVARKGAPS